jgi:hypothetical protein
MPKEPKTTVTCETCVSRLICPTREVGKEDACMGHNDEKVFASLLCLIFFGCDVERRLANVKKIQSGG